MNKLIAVVWKEEGKPFIFDTIMEDRTGVRRRIKTVSYLKNGEIPDNWWDSIVGEAEFQLTEELKQQKGQAIPHEFQ